MERGNTRRLNEFEKDGDLHVLVLMSGVNTGIKVWIVSLHRYIARFAST